MGSGIAEATRWAVENGVISMQAVKGEAAMPPDLSELMLLAAVLTNNIGVASTVLACGADPNYRALEPCGGAPAPAPRPGRLPVVIHAVRAGNPAMLSLLLSVGADPNAPSEKETTTALLEAVSLVCDDERMDALLEILLNGGADPNLAAKATRVRPLSAAAELGRSRAVAKLLAAGAHVNATNDEMQSKGAKSASLHGGPSDQVRVLT